ncbi:MAG: hypothetical protein KGO50_12440 [Myxococcales bacterium]|nr:hypothetical protein [Myxococcales bacterium]
MLKLLELAMYRKLVFFVLVLTAFTAAPAFAQDAEGESAEEVESRFYDFGDMMIDGELLRPDGMFATERGQRQFESLLNLRRSFIPEIEAATDEGSLE